MSDSISPQLIYGTALLPSANDRTLLNREMKRILFAIIVCLLPALCVKAQESYNKVALGFESLHVTYDEDPTDVTKGISLGYAHGFGLSANVPLFIETGARLAWTHSVTHRNEWPSSTEKFDFLSVSLPADFGYKFNFFSDNVGLMLFTGPNFRFNVIGRRQKTIGSDVKHYDSENFMKRDTDYAANVFQFGWRLGATVSHGPFSVGYALTYDFTNYRDVMAGNSFTKHFGEQKTASHSLTVGYTF